MDYGSLVEVAWRITWRHRSLWVLGLFAGGSVGGWNGGSGGSGPPTWNGDTDDLGRLAPEAGRVAEEVGRWLTANLGLVIAVVALLGLLGLVATIVSLIAQGGLSRATADLALGRPSSLGQAWRAGLRLFWRYAGLWLLLAAAGLAIAAIVIGLVVLVVLGGGPLERDLPAVALAIGAVLLGLPLVLVAFVVGIGVGIVVAYAQRAIALRELGPIEALLVGWRLLRANLGTSLVVWVLNLAISIAVGIGLAFGLLVVGGVLAIVGVVLWLIAGGPTALTIAYIAIAAVVLFAVLAVVAAASNTFFWTYWTLAYLRLDPSAVQAAAA